MLCKVHFLPAVVNAELICNNYPWSLSERFRFTVVISKNITGSARVRKLKVLAPANVEQEADRR